MFDSSDQRSIQEDREVTSKNNQQGAAGGSGSKRRAWLWKHAPHYSMEDDLDGGGTTGFQQKSSCSSLENSRRESLNSSHGSPNRNSSPRRNRDSQQTKQRGNVDIVSSMIEEVHRRNRKENKDRGGSPSNESRVSAGARLYRVLEEQALGEAIVASVDTLYVTRRRPNSLCTSAALSNYTRYPSKRKKQNKTANIIILM